MPSILSISPKTKLCAVIGNPIEHSLSPAIHNRAFEELGLDYVYLAFRVEEAKAVMEFMRASENLKGLSVTIPHKVSVIDYLDEVSEVDRKIGSINTVVNKEGRLIGSGTDGPGARQALVDAGVKIKGENIVILGSGGAARALSFDLAYNAAPSSISILGIIEDELNNLVFELKSKTEVTINGDLLTSSTLPARIEAATLCIHSTPVGMYPNINDSVIPENLLHDRLSVMDIVYNPHKTKLIKEAESKGLKTVLGLEMFVNQAALQFEIWTGHAAPKEAMKQVVLNYLNKG